MKIIQMSNRLLWSQIKEMYPNEWVQLADVDWSPSSMTPRRAVVVDHNTDRAELVKNQKDSGDIILFIGAISSSVIQFDVQGIAA